MSAIADALHCMLRRRKPVYLSALALIYRFEFLETPQVNDLQEKWPVQDCQPAHAIQRKSSQWLRVHTLDVRVCFSFCMDYPACTSTTPLVRTNMTKSDWGLLLYCGTKHVDYQLKNKTGAHPAELRGRKPGGGSSAVCRNAVARRFSPPGIEYSSVDVPGASVKHGDPITVKTWQHTGRSYGEELVLYTPDIYAHWQVPMLWLEPYTNATEQPTAFEGFTQGMLIPMEGEISRAMDWEPAKLTEMLQELEKPSERVLTGVWIITPSANEYADAAYVVQRPDMGGRWFVFSTGGVASSSSQVRFLKEL